MKLLWHVTVLAFVFSSATASTRSLQKKSNNSPVYRSHKKHQQIVYIPVPVSPEQYQTMQQHSYNPSSSEREPNVFPHIISIVGDVGKILLDRHNKENIVNHFAHMVNGMVNFVQDITTKGPLSDERMYGIAEQLADKWIDFAHL